MVFWNCRKGQVEQRAAARNIKVRAAPAVETRLRDLQRLRLHVGVFTCDSELVLQSAQLEIIPRDFGGDGHEHVESRGFRNRKPGVGSLHRTSDAAEQIKFPCSVEAGVVKLAFTSAAWRVGRRGGFAEEAVGITSVGLYGGCEVERREPPERAGFLEICRGNAQVMIVGDGAIHESIEPGVVETPPPCREGCVVR
jgi:hypothetical protein